MGRVRGPSGRRGSRVFIADGARGSGAASLDNALQPDRRPAAQIRGFLRRNFGRVCTRLLAIRGCAAPGDLQPCRIPSVLSKRGLGNTTAHDFAVLTAWVDSTPALLLGLLAAAGAFFALKNQQDRYWREQLYLCCWLAVALALYISTTHPTFERYFLLVVPFLGILASVGLYEICSRLDTNGGRFWPVLVLTVLLCLGLGKALYAAEDEYSWQDLEDVASKVDQVTPPGAPLLADEHIYFLTRHAPPSGMEFPDSQKLNLPAALAASLHIVARAELAKRVQAGMFQTVETCDDEDDERILIFNLPQVYSQEAEVHDCRIFWGGRP